MKILLFTEVYDSGGIDTFIINLIESWPNPDDQFILVCNPNYPGLIIIKNRLLSRVVFNEHDIFLYNFLYFKNRAVSIAAKLLSPVLKYFILFLNVFRFGFLFKRLKVDQLMVINGGYPGGDSCRAAIIGWGLLSGKKKGIFNYHNLVMPSPLYLKLQESIVDFFVARNSRLIVTVSKSAADSISNRKILSNYHNTYYIHNGTNVKYSINTNLFKLRAEFGFKANHKICLMLGTYEKRKGHLFLLTAFQRVIQKIKEARLLICGYGSEKEIAYVYNIVKKLNLTGFVFLSNYRADSSSMLQMADLLLISSQEYESFGYTSVEAMAHKKPVVATRIGGIPEVVLDGISGYTTKSDDVKSYSQYIVELLEDDSLSGQLGLRGYQRYINNFSGKLMSKKYHDIFKEIKYNVD
jgi:glycosyltransferase involved in cell wall biosynthesis